MRGLEQFAEQDEALEKGGIICERASMDECTGLAVEVLLAAVEHEEEEEKEQSGMSEGLVLTDAGGRRGEAWKSWPMPPQHAPDVARFST